MTISHLDNDFNLFGEASFLLPFFRATASRAMATNFGDSFYAVEGNPAPSVMCMNSIPSQSPPCQPPQRPPRHRIFVDCTETFRRPVSTGIPRVVTNIVKYGRPAARERGAELVPVRFDRGHFVSVETSPSDDLCRPAAGDAAERRMHPALKRLCKLLTPRTLVRFIQNKVGGMFCSQPQAVRISAGDVLLLPDSSWTVDLWGAVDRALAEGAILGVVQHDFIPIRHPALVPRAATPIFRKWTDETLRRADFIMAVSHVVAAETKDELLKIGRRHVAEHGVQTFRNGADLPTPSGRETIRQELIDFFGGTGHGPYLTVGTIEPRKNQATLLAAINRVLQSAPDARFIFAGIVGWRGEPIAESIRQHPGWPQNIRHFSDLTDNELRFAYKHAKAIVFPSLAEGYGLPIVEALANETRVFASDIPVHREIGGKCCVYFDPLNPAQLADALVAFSLHGEYGASWPPVDHELPSWRAAANQIVEAALTHAHPVTAPPSREQPMGSAASPLPRTAINN
jgi:alpha-1,2-rhamnosyltransferase